MDDEGVDFERLTDLSAEKPTLVEGFPGLGMVASIAVDRITDQLGLEQHGIIHADDMPPVVSFTDGHVQDSVRVYAGSDPDIMTLQSDIPIPPNAFDSMASCVLDGLAPEFGRAIFIAGAPAESEEQRGAVTGVATTDAVADDLEAAGITLSEGTGVVGGVTGALAERCYHQDVEAAILVVRGSPYVPDPGAARVLIEEALEPLVDFDIDTSELQEQAEQIQQRKQQIVQQLQQYQQQQSQSTRPMYQ